MTSPNGIRNGRSWSGTARRSAPRVSVPAPKDSTVADVTKPTSCCQLGNGRNTISPTTNVTKQAEQRHAALGRAGERGRRVAVAADRVGHPRGHRRVDQPGVGRRDDGVDVQQLGQPAEADERGDGRERAERVGEGERVPAVRLREVLRAHRADERDLQQDVDDAGDEHRADDRDRDVALRVAALAGELDALPESEIGEHDAAGRDRGEDALRAVRGEAVVAEVAAVERGDQERDHDERDDRRASTTRRRC